MENKIENSRDIDIHSKKKKKSRIFSIIFVILLNLGIVAYFVIKELNKQNSGEEVSQLDLSNVNVAFIGLGILCFLLALFAEFMKYRRMLLSTGGRLDRRGAFEVATYGKYADNVTPMGAGGQPFQIHYLHRRGYSGGASTTVTLNGFLSQQFAFIIIALLVLIFGKQLPDEVLALRIMAYVGLGFYCAIPIMIISFALFPKPFAAVVLGILKLAQKMHIVKDYEASAHSFLKGLEEYVVLIKKAFKSPTILIPVMFWAFVYQFAILSIPFFSVMAFKGSTVWTGGDWWTAFSSTVYIYLAITIIPTPGNAGAAEVSFNSVFASLGGAAFWGMLFWRLLVYYSWIIIGLVVVIKTTVSNTFMHKKEVPSDRPLNICLVCDNFFPDIDGVIRTIDQYAREFVRMGHHPVVVVPALDGADDSNLPYEVYRLPKFKVPGIPFDSVKPFLGSKAKKYLKSQNFDVIHIHSPMILGKMMQRFGRKNKIPVFTTFHSKYYDDTLNITHSKLLARTMVKFILHFYHRVDVVWACSASTGETLKSYGFNGPIGVMENGVEKMPQGLVNDFVKEAIETYHLPQDKRILLFVGQQIWHKGLKLVLDTTKALCEKEDIYHAVIAGVGYDAEAVKAYAKEIGIEDKVTFVGKVRSRKALFGLYELSDLFFFPSLYDNAPLVVREAALAGVPALLVKGSTAAEIITDGENGYLGENNVDSMVKRIEDAYASGKMKEVGEKASKTIPIPWEEISHRVIERYIEESKHPE